MFPARHVACYVSALDEAGLAKPLTEPGADDVCRGVEIPDHRQRTLLRLC
jgi:hypothetical protein